MGGLTSALAPIIQIGSAIGTVASAVQPFYKDAIDRSQQKDKNSLAYQQALTSAANQKAQNVAEDQAVEARRKDLLRRSLAKQRAEFGSQGIGSSDGSSEAVLGGIFDESDEQRARREQLTALRNNALDQSVLDKNQVNLLEQAQLIQDQNFNRLSDLF